MQAYLKNWRHPAAATAVCNSTPVMVCFLPVLEWILLHLRNFFIDWQLVRFLFQTGSGNCLEVFDEVLDVDVQVHVMPTLPSLSCTYEWLNNCFLLCY